MIALRGANPERAYTDGAGGLGAGLAESRRQRLRVNTGSKISGVIPQFCLRRKSKAAHEFVPNPDVSPSTYR